MPKTKKNLKVRDLKPKKDAKGGGAYAGAVTGAQSTAKTGAVSGAQQKILQGSNNN